LTQAFTIRNFVNDGRYLFDIVREMDDWKSYRNRQCCYMTFRHLEGKSDLEQLKRDLPNYAYLLSIADYMVVEIEKIPFRFGKFPFYMDWNRVYTIKIDVDVTSYRTVGEISDVKLKYLIDNFDRLFKNVL